eukprot:TRINITY_DN4015_c0_g2_i2.p1 TRINITY_DN4015_c0_g2~~TRINITY_DN4015_c0_g2_i2.p1  ORF type:complete len:140 (-),score=8.74 TRINITY_DN4015_c0_g2_i2:196-615(-)
MKARLINLALVSIIIFFHIPTPQGFYVRTLTYRNGICTDPYVPGSVLYNTLDRCVSDGNSGSLRVSINGTVLTRNIYQDQLCKSLISSIESELNCCLDDLDSVARILSPVDYFKVPTLQKDSTVNNIAMALRIVPIFGL